MPKAPWWLCCGWWSPWCVADTVMHELGLSWHPVCRIHDRVADKHYTAQSQVGTR